MHILELYELLDFIHKVHKVWLLSVQHSTSPASTQLYSYRYVTRVELRAVHFVAPTTDTIEAIFCLFAMQRAILYSWVYALGYVKEDIVRPGAVVYRSYECQLQSRTRPKWRYILVLCRGPKLASATGCLLTLPVPGRLSNMLPASVAFSGYALSASVEGLFRWSRLLHVVT